MNKDKMIHREDPEGLIVVKQPSHAWLSGQMARNWGNEDFGHFDPWEEVCLGAEQHDIGWLLWEETPTLNAHTGRPHNFFEVPVESHTKLWTQGVQFALSFGNYPALLVSLHGVSLYKSHSSQASAEEAQLIQDFISQQQRFQEERLKCLRNDPYYAPYTTSEIVTRNQQLVRALDRLSLAMCMGDTEQLIEAPAAKGTTTLKLKTSDSDLNRFTISPWPFKQDRVVLVGEGHRLLETFADEETMRSALALAPRITLKFSLEHI